MPRSITLAVPLAAFAAVLTLVCSGFMLSKTGWQKSTRFHVEVGDFASEATSLLDFMQGSSDDAYVPTAVVPAVSSSQGADAGSPPPVSTAPPVAALAGFADSEYDGFFLYARDEPVPSHDPAYLRKLLKSLLGMAVLLKRTLVLPAALCKCRDANLTDCDGPPVAPFDCPLREALNADAWRTTSLVRIKPARFLARSPETLPEIVRCSHLRVLLPDGMDDSELTFALRQYASTRWLEITTAVNAFCGWDTRMPGNKDRLASFTAAADQLLQTPDAPAAVPMHICTHYRGGTGEVLQFTNLGCNSKHVVTAPRERLPPSVRNLPEGTDIMVTFATGSVSTMAINWVYTVRKVGVQEVLIGALDQAMMDACDEANVPCILIQGGEITKALAGRSAGNVRSDPKLYPKMSVLKVGFYGELLSFGYNVWACDADAVFINDPRAMMREHPWDLADIAIATDCIDVPSDERYTLLHCDYNTGLVYMRARPAVIEFTDRWRETIATAKETRIRDQAAFNMMTKLSRPVPFKKDGMVVPRLFSSTNGGDGRVVIGVLPLSRFLNGHTFFVQHVHTLPQAKPPLSVHMTYQFAEGSKFAYGKRQRLRQAGLWLVEPESYYNGRYLTLSAEASNLLIKPMDSKIDSRVAVDYHLQEARHRVAVLRPLLGIAKALGRALILPRMLCYCDFMWKEMLNCRVGGAETMRLPFDCPMDHVLDTPKWFENELGVEVREPAFLQNPRVAPNISSAISRVSLPEGKALNDAQLIAHLKPHENAPILELSSVKGSFCGFTDWSAHRAFKSESQRLLHYTRTPFCMMEGSNNAPLFSQCCSPRKPGDKFFPCMHGFDPPADLPACSS